MNGRILIVEDDTTFRGLLAAILEDAGHEVIQAVNGAAGLAKLQQESFDLVLSDLKMPKMGGLELFKASRFDEAAPPFVLITAFGTVEEAVAAIKDGVSDFLTKPLKDPATLRALVDRLLLERTRTRRLEALDEAELTGLPPLEILFAGAAMEKVRWLVGEVAPTEATVLIGGESGTGKELLARYIHLTSPRKGGPFIAVNCAAIPENLMESELFGHERGAFTGATTTRQGKFELASSGTIMLDEIGEMPLPMQAKLLRVLQERNFQRVGGSREIHANVRILAATNRDLADEITARHFREDLFYRLNVFPITLPPLRDRLDAIDDLAEFLVRLHSREMGKQLTGIASSARKSLRAHHWPGNIRELQNVLERAVILARSEITITDLPDLIRSPGKSSGAEEHGLLKEAEHQAILTALKATAGNRRLAADRLGISRRTLQYRLKEFGVAEDNGEEE
ncbi:MAG: sigma-54-dependent Fis family transcriptional regulator [Desulfobulbaceae bacterium]|nr:sigma-54-dependent Fis family transcriptional regulator [Desulfobulbaceae bacterium]